MDFEDEEDNDGVQFVSKGTSQPVTCQICRKSLHGKTTAEKQTHYDQHFRDNEPSSSNIGAKVSPSHPPRAKNSGVFGNISRFKPRSSPNKRDVFWHNHQDASPPPNFTPGLIPILREALLKSQEKGSTVRAALCYEGVVHIATEMWDRGWGCGYRNFLMACTALVTQDIQPLYFPLLDSPSPPSVRNLQVWIEDAWKAGYDEEGAMQLKHKLVGTTKWIGTAELYTAYVHRGIPCRLVEFVNTSAGADRLTQWVERYFTSPHGSIPLHNTKESKGTTVDNVLRGASPVSMTRHMPLVLQHSGHSRTIVGYEKNRDGNINLLLFDPARSPKAEVRRAALAGLIGTTSRTSSPQKQSRSPLKIMDHFLHPRSGGMGKTKSEKKRSAQESDIGTPARNVKRVRGGLQARTDDVIVIDDEDQEVEIVQTGGHATEAHRIDYTKVLNFFRVNAKKIQSHDKYQILYFTLEAPLTEPEKQQRRIVTSQRVE